MISKEVGESIPSNTRHAISVCLPTWEATVGYEEGDIEVVGKMQTGYPRFFLHKSIQNLSSVLVGKYAKDGETCMIFPSYNVAKRCREFMKVKVIRAGNAVVPRFRILQLATSKPMNEEESAWKGQCNIAVLFFPKDHVALAKKYWQHTGEIISSRMAEYVLCELLERKRSESMNCTSTSRVNSNVGSADVEEIMCDEEGFIEQRYGRNLDFSFADHAKLLIKKRIAKQLADSSDEPDTGDRIEETRVLQAVDMQQTGSSNVLNDSPNLNTSVPLDNTDDLVSTSTVPPEPIEQGEFDHINISDSNVDVTRSQTIDPETDVYLFPSGMAAIFTAHRLLLQLDSNRVNRTKQDDLNNNRNGYSSPHSLNTTLVGYGPPYKKTVMFGFPYTDTLSILRDFNHTHFLGMGDSEAMEQLKAILHGGEPILAVFIETPSNPLLKMGDLLELRKLADAYDFYVIIDDTIGGFINVDVLQYADIVCSSLTKIFSGDSNVMAGSLVLNPSSRLYKLARRFFASDDYEDLLWCEDSIYLERNSRDCVSRSMKINENAERLLKGTLLPLEGTLFKKIYYPSLTSSETKANYDAVKCQPNGGYGGLFSLTFFDDECAKAFFNSLDLCKGPSLGTNFTLACPYTILAHYGEMDVVAKYGLEKNLVRVSIGLEDFGYLETVFSKAAQNALQISAK
ncbi:cystathionine gamma-synthase Ecym_5169 [Eremothecium cymbalariae DBVPG|uniref:cystathionine gamma-synthase n=1 Tax=Eremothecium cymbalariae (strain CBS 270.75 / DBVPG 7215 / KCTC 17166 / NRRL Y-17582) TaxID=931890 RepID=I6ND01_ERECY|nr:hypothetical protein Ecym_5169 [Eremothecium cymbalariae DBVPG\